MRAFGLSILGFVSLFFVSACKEDEPLSCEDTVCQTGYVAKNVNGRCECVNENPDDNYVVKTGFIDSDEVWTADNIYELKGKVVVQDGATLTIKPGTIIKGREGTASLASALIIARGAKINACGTADSAITMTSILDNIKVGEKAGTNLDETQNGLWGGLIVLGRAPGSFEGDVEEYQIEGLPGNETFGLYGGNDAEDNSGTLCYVSIRHGGASIGQNNEINGLTLGGVGSGTTIHDIEVVANLDDGIEFFGGTVNVSNAVVWGQGDDAFDVDQGYSGTLSNFLYIAGSSSDHGLEIDGPEGAATGRFTMKDGTLRGVGDVQIADFRSNAMGLVKDCKIFNFSDKGTLEISDDRSSANYTSGTLEIKGLQFVDTRSISDICSDKSPSGNEETFDQKMETDNTKVAMSEATVGANISVFSWTLTAQKNDLSDF